MTNWQIRDTYPKCKHDNVAATCSDCSVERAAAEEARKAAEEKKK